MALSKKMGIDHIPHLIKDSRVLMRVDFNVPMKDGVVTDPKRIVSTLPSINYLLDQGAKSVILMSHMGRPKGSKQMQFSLGQIQPAVSDLLGKNVQFVPDCVGADTAKACGESKNGEVLLLENMRFYTEEEGKGEING
jgi:phosphoglycerate kinase